MSFKDIVRDGLSAWDLPAPDDALARLEAFCSLVLETNKVMNLTAVTEPDAFAVRHVLDSLSILTCADLHGKKVIDIGTGPGFPGMPLKLYDPSLDITFVDSTQKRIDFIVKSADALGLSVTAFAARAEELIAKGMRANFEIVLSRAVAPLNILSELCLPYLRMGGQFLPLKSDNEAFAAELKQARRAIDVLGGALQGTRSYTLPGVEGKKCVVLIQKTGETPAKYPRRYAKISQNPL
ncbi:MAG TPA: 16S rRNA (guanine(527)-N(7))-methyltransferase RsmG [Candidatus Ventrousia excrementavium]|uniref:Ribosomal RNA small subunit methyltransferase G n=1 Tax=Candidatus Ventrousia excrementavium TaxID=2840961 RepID=A0A9D1LJS4_9CLOT|nr:16S rRNA (guanine(527)-N(7))-methyltransferase RsmG [Candidatus Ventrousia excrementavium]